MKKVKNQYYRKVAKKNIKKSVEVDAQQKESKLIIFPKLLKPSFLETLIISRDVDSKILNLDKLRNLDQEI
jgi:hypothetical protein